MIAAALEGEIVHGQLPAGQRLDEQAIGDRFKVSRTPVREALRLLASSGLITLEPRLGAVVSTPTVGHVLELFELVGELEAVAARLACERMTETSREEIIRTHDDCRLSARGTDAEHYIRCNDAFHRAIHAAACNDALAEQISQLNRRLAPYRRFITFRPGRRQIATQEHERLADALLAGDPAGAASAMKEHVQMLADDAVILAHSLLK